MMIPSSCAIHSITISQIGGNTYLEMPSISLCVLSLGFPSFGMLAGGANALDYIFYFQRRMFLDMDPTLEVAHLLVSETPIKSIIVPNTRFPFGGHITMRSSYQMSRGPVISGTNVTWVSYMINNMTYGGFFGTYSSNPNSFAST